METLLPAPTIADRLAAILKDAYDSVAGPGARNHAAGPLTILIYTMLRRVAERFAVIAARFEAGTLLAPRRTGYVRTAAATSTSPVGSRSLRLLPNGFAWLIKLVPEAVALGTRLQHLLETDPEMQALLAAAPQLGRMLRSLLWMSGIRPAPAILRRVAAAPSSSRTSGSVAPDHVACDHVAWDRMAVPETVASPDPASVADPFPPPGPIAATAGDASDAPPRSHGEPQGDELHGDGSHGGEPHGGEPLRRQPRRRRSRPPEPEWLRSPRATYEWMNRMLGITDAPPFPE